MTASISILSNLKVTGAVVLDRDSSEFPANPKIGTLVIKNQNLYAYIVLASGLASWYPLVRETSTSYVHTQGVESSVWTVNHSLNTNDLWYQIKDNDGQIISPASFEVVTVNTFRVTFSEAITGTIVVVGTNALELNTIKAETIDVGANVRIDTSGLKIDGVPVITGTTMTIGDGVDTKITYTDKQQLNIVAGTGIELIYDDVNKKITLAAPGASVTPSVMNAAIAEAIEVFKAQSYSHA